MICPNCGTTLRPGASFCRECGAEIDTGNFAPPGYATPQSPYSAPQGSGYYAAPYGGSGTGEGGGMAVASLVLGIVAAVFGLLTCIPYVCYCTSVFGSIAAVVGIVLGAVGRSTADPSRRSMATWGIVLSIVGIVLYIVVAVLYVLITAGLVMLPAFADYTSY
jgi:hypothetical protein